MRFGSIVLLALIISGCSNIATRSPLYRTLEPPTEGVSLFPEDEGLSDDAIRRILDTKIETPEQVRIALLYIEHSSGTPYSRMYFSDDDLQKRTVLIGDSIEQLVKQQRVYDASYIPSFLMPKQKSVGRIRQAAARYQADWVMLIKTQTIQTSRQKVFSDDEARAECIAECAVLDTRTGVIIFSARADQDVYVSESKQDWSLDDTITRAEEEAIRKAMAENIDSLVKYLSTLD